MLTKCDAMEPLYYRNNGYGYTYVPSRTLSRDARSILEVGPPRQQVRNAGRSSKLPGPLAVGSNWSRTQGYVAISLKVFSLCQASSCDGKSSHGEFTSQNMYLVYVMLYLMRYMLSPKFTHRSLEGFHTTPRIVLKSTSERCDYISCIIGRNVCTALHGLFRHKCKGK